MSLVLTQVGNPVLRAAARPLQLDEIQTTPIQELIYGMRDLMRATPGVGLAAPQVGIGLQVAVIEDRPEYLAKLSKEVLAERERRAVPYFALINPRIVSKSEKQILSYEGCLSVAGFQAEVKRSHSVVVEYLDESGENREIKAEGWFARILQHEIDHLLGHLYIDTMDSRSFTTTENLEYFRNV